jgi:hypothetical protein
MNNINEAVDSFVFNRLESFTEYNSDPDYIKFEQEIKELKGEAESLLPNNKKELIQDLLDQNDVVNGIASEYSYRLGFKDAIKLLSHSSGIS